MTISAIISAAAETSTPSIGVDAIATSLAALIASVTGYLAYRANKRSKSTEQAQKLTDETAELAKTQVEGWTTLIESLSKQYKDASEEATELRRRLTAGNRRFDEITEDLRLSKKEHQEDLIRLDKKIRLLCDEIIRLGGNPDHLFNGDPGG